MPATENRKSFRLRRLTRFSLRTAIIAMTIVAIWLGLHMQSVRQQRASIEAVRKYGGWVCYEYQLVQYRVLDVNAQSPVPEWLLDLLGHDHFHDVVYVNMFFGKTNGKHHFNYEHSEEVLPQLSGFPELETLVARLPQVTDEDLLQLAQLRDLQCLVMYDSNKISDQGVEHLASIRSLQKLSLESKQITDKSLRLLNGLPELHSLGVHGEGFTDHSLAHVQDMTQLRKFWIDNSEITDGGLIHLKGLTQLEILGLQNSEVTDAGLRHLMELKRLEFVDLDGSRVDDASWLMEQLPACDVRISSPSSRASQVAEK